VEAFRQPGRVSVKVPLILCDMAVETCFAALSSVVGLDVVELWSQGPNGLSLLHAYVNQRSPISSYTDLIASYHKGDCENEVSRTLCKKSMKSSYGFYWQTRRERTVHPEIPLHTALAFNLPRDNINTDVYIVAYSIKYIKVSSYINRTLHNLLIHA
jgi:hypothetical protein